MLESKKNKLEFLWPNTFTESGRKLARNEGIVSLVCFFGQYLVRLDDTYLKIESGVANLEFDKTVYLCSLAVLAFFAWRVYKWGRISSVIAVVIAVAELGIVSISYVPGGGLPVWNGIMVYLAGQGARGCFAHKKYSISNA